MDGVASKRQKEIPSLEMLASYALGLLLIVARSAFAVPLAISPARDLKLIEARDNTAAPTALSASAKADIATFATIASAAYCSAASITSGAAISSIVAIAAAGNDQSIPGWFVGYSKSLGAIIVAHQGTNPTSFISVLEDINFLPTALSESMFPGAAAAGAKVHSGFQSTQAYTAPQVLAAVKTGVATYGTSKVITVGHSLGASIAELDALYLKLQIPSLTISARLFGLPRTGNPAFGPWALKVIPDSVHTTNKNDPVPRLPGQALGFQQINGEQYIAPSSVYESCPGVENVNCALGQTFNLAAVLPDHLGPYNGVYMGTCLI